LVATPEVPAPRSLYGKTRLSKTSCDDGGDRDANHASSYERRDE
jgi:hypothetical protein